MSKLNFHQFQVLSFDCYGTLIDWERGILGAVRSVLSNRKIVIADKTILETYAQIESEVEAGPYRSYRDILRTVMSRMSERFGFVPNNTESDSIVASLPNWPPFEDTVAALKVLKSRYRLAIISNTDDDLFAGTNRHLGVKFDYIITAAQVGAYKPSPRIFEHALEKIGCEKSRLLHVAQSLFHDHVTAKQIGLSTVWINRRRALPRRVSLAANPDAEFPDLATLVSAMGL